MKQHRVHSVAYKAPRGLPRTSPAVWAAQLSLQLECDDFLTLSILSCSLFQKSAGEHLRTSQKRSKLFETTCQGHSKRSKHSHIQATTSFLRPTTYHTPSHSPCFSALLTSASCKVSDGGCPMGIRPAPGSGAVEGQICPEKKKPFYGKPTGFL